jgi:hypothetical protein
MNFPKKIIPYAKGLLILVFLLSSVLSSYPRSITKRFVDKPILREDFVLPQNTLAEKILALPAEPIIDVRDINSNALVSRTLWQEPYLIFQTSYGETISDHYLMVLDTQQGKLYFVHKGYHSRFWIEEGYLRFLHVDQYFECPLGSWQQWRKTPPPDLVNASMNLKVTMYHELPSSLQSIEWANLHNIFQGSFTKSNKSELILISGRRQGYYIGIYSIYPDPFRLIHLEHLPVPEEEYQYNFTQVLYEDLNNDGCQEVLINGAGHTWNWDNDPLLVFDFAQSKDKPAGHIIPMPSVNEEYFAFGLGMLHRPTHGNIQLHMLEDWKIEHCFELVFDQNNEWSLKKIPSAPIPSKHLQIPPSKHLKIPLHQQFYASGKHLQDARVLRKTRSKRSPDLNLPDQYDPDDPGLLSLESKYHQFRNRGIQNYIEKYDRGWNPFEGFFVGTNWDLTFKLGELEAEDYLKNWSKLVDLIPILVEDTIFYLLINLCNPSYQLYLQPSGNQAEAVEVPTTFITLYNQSFTKIIDNALMDDSVYKGIHESDKKGNQEYSIRFLLPLPGEEYFLVFFPWYRSRQYYTPIRVTKEGFHEQASSDNSGIWYVPHPEGMKFKIEVLFTHLGTRWGSGGNNVRMKYHRIIDPSTTRDFSHHFPEEISRDLDYVYRQYFYYRWRPEAITSFDLEESLEFYILEAIEEVVYYGKNTRIGKGFPR